MTGLDWLGASACFAAVVALLIWAFAALADAWPRLPEARAESHKPRSPMGLYLDGGGDLSNPRVVALLDEAERGWDRHAQPGAPAQAPAEPSPLHAHQITRDDAALIRMMAGAHFGPDATVTLPSGRTITGTEMRQWIETNDA